MRSCLQNVRGSDDPVVRERECRLSAGRLDFDERMSLTKVPVIRQNASIRRMNG